MIKTILINITTYNREKKLNNLINVLKKQNLNNIKLSIIIWDDHSDYDINLPHYKFSFNHGKELAWLKFKKIFGLIPLKYDYYMIMPDDFTINDNFIVEALRLYDSIKERRKIALSFHNDSRKFNKNWTNFNSKKLNEEIIQTQWLDMFFICEKQFFKKISIKYINPNRWEKNKDLGSGIGEQISHQLHAKGYWMYNTKNNIAYHEGNDDSKMNPNVRKRVKL